MMAGTKNGLAALAAICLALALPAGAGAKPLCGKHWQAPRLATDHQLRTSVLCLVNRERERRGIARLHYSADLRRSATAHSRSMVRSGRLSHYGPRGSTPTARIARSGYLDRARSYRLAENIAAGRGRSNGSPGAIVRNWMRSPGHRRNILDRRLRDFGVGVARGDTAGRSRNAATYTLDLATRGR